MTVRPTPESGFSYIARLFGRLGEIPLRWLIICRSALSQPSGFGSHPSQKSWSPLEGTSI
ncbi:hypothetical protein PR202_ga24516 [Eleusine coracana subsp. coracana]|uniref:Uncharacterized protein n=1 Tax=Eleusine coracana subsp. coracana TaxID=191504 RepID=A0AAV5D9P7_ELECO|nr:hypothetical protein PR202_ga24516 [Eleusine coracana subsp. coracana]